MIHKHIVNDTDKHFSIDPATREIVNESGKFVLVQGDHKSEQFTFSIPRYVDGHDMSLCNMVQVHYTNTDSETKAVNEDVHETSDLRISQDSEDGEEAVIFSWLITANATQYVGSLAFSISYNCVSNNGEIEYSWNTVDYTEISIKSRHNNSESVITTYPDVLAKWRAETFQMVQDQIDDVVDGSAYVHRTGDTMTGPLNVIAPTENAHAANKGYVDEKRKLFVTTLTANNWEGNAAPYTQRIGIEGILSTDRPHYGAVYDADNETRMAQKEAFALVDDLDTENGAVVFTCFEDKPSVNLTIFLLSLILPIEIWYCPDMSRLFSTSTESFSTAAGTSPSWV